MQINLAGIPDELKAELHWIVWKTVYRDDKPTKVPFQVSGYPAKSNDPHTWASFDEAVERMDGYDGIGFMFSEHDPYCGVDLDGCRAAGGEVGGQQRRSDEDRRKAASYPDVVRCETEERCFDKAAEQH